jgi:Plasmid pRiA4b ORF-3-like protein
MIFEFKITLRDMPVPVWRKIQMDSESTFYELHQVLQLAFDWQNAHLHTFHVEKTNGRKEEFIEITSDSEFNHYFESSLFKKINNRLDEQMERLSNWFKLPKDRVTYVYDFGDNWEHDIILTKITEPEIGIQYPRCIAANNLVPPEDSRGELLMGEIDLEADNKALLIEINEVIEENILDLMSLSSDHETNIWEELLATTKEFYKLKPWKMMDDRHIFAVEDPDSEELLFCSVLGNGGEFFGLAVYVGEAGYQSLMNSLNLNHSQFQILVNQRSIVLDFADREELDKEDYKLVKKFDIPFRGKKAWPSFRSYKPGYYPWFIDIEEARILLLALEATMEVYEELNDELVIPDMYEEQMVYFKIPRINKDGYYFENYVLDMDDYLNEDELEEVSLAVSEIELKRIEKLSGIIPASIEFVTEYIDMPIQNDPDERPVFPILVLAVDHRNGTVVYNNLVTEALEPGVIQSELLNLFQTIGAIPEHMMMSEETARNVEPISSILHLDIQTKGYESKADRIIEEILK